jgi:hypothetical protein
LFLLQKNQRFFKGPLPSGPCAENFQSQAFPQLNDLNALALF